MSNSTAQKLVFILLVVWIAAGLITSSLMGKSVGKEEKLPKNPAHAVPVAAMEEKNHKAHHAPFSFLHLNRIKWGNGPESFRGELSLLGAEHTSEGADFRLTLHLKTPDMYTAIGRIQMALSYDPTKFTFVRATGISGTPDASEKGRLLLKIKGARHYASTSYRASRVCELYFRTVAPSGSGQFAIDSAKFEAGGRKIPVKSLVTHGKTVTIHAKDTLDLNKDGYFTAADLGLARRLPKQKQEELAKKLEILPYKRVIVFGIDGAGISVSDSAPYFPSLTGKKEEVGSRLHIPRIKQILKQGAVSYTVRTTLPSKSAPNWESMLTGVDYSKHQVSNKTVASKAYSEGAPYPTLFKKLREQLPVRKTAVFAGWASFANGLIEPEEGTSLHFGKDSEITKQFVEYCDSSQAKDTSLVFVHFVSLDNTGHRRGWFTKSYYGALAKIDQYIGTMYDALARNGLVEDSLILLTADHGGGMLTKNGGLSHPRTHGQTTPFTTTVFLGASGRTVSAGNGETRLMHGGTTKDLAAIVLAALRRDSRIGDAKLPPGLFFAQKDHKAAAGEPVVRLKRENDAATEFLSVQGGTSDTAILFGRFTGLAGRSYRAEAVDPRVSILQFRQKAGRIRLVAETESSFPQGQPLIRIYPEGDKDPNAAVHLEEASLADGKGKEWYPLLKEER
ncbi:alkaline phosphatase family protein [Gorillibacterium massiliense]|uniref:alkaline phosphatase family protein n=1 Tax=Gorillibacterium massiliense TaxID=1280390 RepID=UPI0004B99A58|nr:alkaline phosphatase [Gorillibacterium massiliense]